MTVTYTTGLFVPIIIVATYALINNVTLRILDPLHL